MEWAAFSAPEMSEGCLFRYGTKRADEKLTEKEWLAQHADACEKITVQEHEEITVNGIRYDFWRCTYTQNNQPMVEWYVEQQGINWANGCFVFRCPAEAWETYETTFQSVLDAVHYKLRKETADGVQRIYYEDTWGGFSFVLPPEYFAGEPEQWVMPISNTGSANGIHIGGIGTSYIELWYEPDDLEYYPLDSEEILTFPGPDGKAWHVFRRQKDERFGKEYDYFSFRLTDADGNVVHITGDAGFDAVYADAAAEIMQRILESVQITMQ